MEKPSRAGWMVRGGDGGEVVVLVEGRARADNILIGEGACFGGLRSRRQVRVAAFSEVTGMEASLESKTTKGKGTVTWRSSLWITRRS